MYTSFMVKRLPKLDTYLLDEYLETKSKKFLNSLLGKRVSWHGQAIGILSKLKNGSIVIKMRADCGNCFRKLGYMFLKSGLHNGAFCYVVDEKGKYIANLRDQIPICRKGYGCQKHKV